MTEAIRERLTEYVLDLLDAAERREVEGALSASLALQHEVRAIREALATAALPPAQSIARAEGRQALLEALSTGARYRPFLADLSRHFDLPPMRVRELLHAIDDVAQWQPGPMPGIAVMHFAAGPNARAHDTGFVRLPRGLQFPYHRHLGHEVNYVLEGALRDGDGTLVLPGEAIERGPDSAHEFSVPADADALIAVVQDGFEFIDKG